MIDKTLLKKFLKTWYVVSYTAVYGFIVAVSLLITIDFLLILAYPPLLKWSLTMHPSIYYTLIFILVSMLVSARITQLQSQEVNREDPDYIRIKRFKYPPDKKAPGI